LKSTPTSLTVPLEAGATSAIVYPAAAAPLGAAIVLGHGAGAGQQSAWMISIARALSERGADVVTFNFPYIEQKRRIPDRAPILEACVRSVVERVRETLPSARAALFMGGKSMGGRIATQAAAADALLPVAGLVLLGYPLHPPGKPEQRRDKHLPAVRRPMLFIQGTRDAFGTPSELEPIIGSLAPQATLHAIAGGDHSFKISRKDPSAQEAVFADVQDTIVAWMQSITASAPSRRPPA
jgi:predicted alpha/beta-hydrolase family hydrolase